MDKVLYIVKKNLLSIICGVIALIAIIALFFPLAGMRTKFRAELTQRSQNYTKATSLAKAPRFLPIVDPGAEPTPLPRFPTLAIIDSGKVARDAVHTQSDELMNKAVAMNQAGHDLLFAPDILPNPGDRAFQYRTAYLDQVRKQIPAIMQGVVPPSPDEINRRIDERHQSEVEDKIVKINGVEFNRDKLERDFLQTKAGLPEQLRQESASQHKIYIDPLALSVNQIMTNENARPTPADIWFAQLSLWIQQDVANSINAANNTLPQSNIFNDAIKRLSQLKFSEGIAAYVQSAVPPPADGTDVVDFSRSPTGRVCNDLYDVIQFYIVMDVDQRQIPLILHEFQHDRFMTVLGVELTQVDTAQSDAQGYIYGSAPVVQLSMNCEILFMRKWTVPLMPDDVKAALKIIPVDPNAPPGSVLPSPAAPAAVGGDRG